MEVWSESRPPRRSGGASIPDLRFFANDQHELLKLKGACGYHEDGAVFMDLISHRSQRLGTKKGEIPKGKDWERARMEERAKKICQGCGVLDECLEFYLPRVEPAGFNGVVANLTHDELKALAKELGVKQLKSNKNRGRVDKNDRRQDDAA